MQIDKFCTGKRGKALYKLDAGLADYYNYYKQKNTFTSEASKFSPSKKSLVVDSKLYKQIVKDYFLLLSQELITNPEGISISPLGLLRIRKRKMSFQELTNIRKLKIDWRASKDSGSLVYHTNEHSNHHFYWTSWSKNPRYIFLPMYVFVANRLNIKRKTKPVLQSKIDFYSKNFRYGSS